MVIKEWLDKDSCKKLDKTLIVKITPLVPFSLCRNKGNTYTFNIVPNKRMLSGLFQNFMNIHYDNAVLPTEYKSESETSYQNNNELSFYPIIDCHFIIKGIKYPKINAILTNYEATLNVNEKTKELQTAPTLREYGITSDSYYLKLKCSHLFYDYMNRKENSYNTLYIGNKQSICSIALYDEVKDIEYENYVEELSYETFEDCIKNFETMDLWMKYGFTYLLNKLFPSYIENPDIIKSIKIYDKIEDIKRICIEENNYVSFETAIKDEINNIQYFTLKPYSEKKDINHFISLEYSTKKGNSSKQSFIQNVLSPINKNEDMSFIKNKRYKNENENLNGLMWVNPYYLSNDRILNNRANHPLKDELVLFSILTTLTYDKFYEYQEKNDYVYIPNLDFINMLKYHRYITSELKNEVGDLLYCKADNKTLKPKLFYSNMKKFFTFKPTSTNIDEIFTIINLNYYISQILQKSKYSYDEDFIQNLSQTYWNVISPKRKFKISANKDIQYYILQSYSKGFDCLKNFNIKNYDNKLLIYKFAQVLKNPVISNAYRFNMTYMKTNSKLMNENNIYKFIINNNSMITNEVKENAIKFGRFLNKMSFRLAKEKIEKKSKLKLKEEKFYFVKTLSMMVNNSNNPTDMLYTINNMLLRYNKTNVLSEQFNTDLFFTSFSEEEFNVIKQIIFVSLTTESFTENNAEDNEEIENNEEVITI